MLQGGRNFSQYFRRYGSVPLRPNFPAGSAITLDVSLEEINPGISQRVSVLAMRLGAVPLALALIPRLPVCLEQRERFSRIFRMCFAIGVEPPSSPSEWSKRSPLTECN